MDPLSDVALVEMAKAGDRQAFDDLSARWFDPVYDFVVRMVRDRDEAADIAQDTFLKAMNALGGLQEGASFKSWIFTIARNTALNRLERLARTRPLSVCGEDGEEVELDVVDTDRLGSPEEASEANALAPLVWEASAGLDPRQLSILDLHLRQGLDSSEIADVLGVTKRNGYVMLNRLQKAVEDAIGAFIMFKDGRRHCDDLDAVLIGARIDGMSPDVRKLVDRHVGQCPACEERRKKLISPLAVFGALAAVGAPPAARAQGLGRIARDWPGPALSGPAGGSAPPGDRAFVGPGGEDAHLPGGLLSPRALAIMGGAAVLFLFALFIFPVLGSGGGGDSPPPGDDGPAGAGVIATATPTKPRAGQGGASRSPSSAATPTGTSLPGAGASTPTAGPTGTPTRTAGTGTPTATRTATPAGEPSTATPTPTSTASPTSTATPIPCEPTLFTNTGTLNIPAGQSSSFDLFVSCGTSGYVVSGGGGWVSTSPSAGSVNFGSSKSIFVTIDTSSLSEGPHTTTLVIEGNNTVNVVVNTTVPGNSPEIQRFVATCTASTVTFAATITDDYGVASTSVAWSFANGASGTTQLSPAGNDWTATIDRPGAAAPIALSSATLTTTDHAGHTASASAGC